MKILATCSFLLLIMSCNSNKQVNTLQKMVVYSFPENIQTPVSVDRASIRSGEPKIIEDTTELKEIGRLLKELRPHNETHELGSLILSVDLHYENGDVIELNADKWIVEIGSDIFQISEELTKTLVPE